MIGCQMSQEVHKYSTREVWKDLTEEYRYVVKAFFAQFIKNFPMIQPVHDRRHGKTLHMLLDFIIYC